LKEKIKNLKYLEEEIMLLKELAPMENVENELRELENKIDKEEIKIFLNGKYDRHNAILSIQAGQGGEDAQDWAFLLLKMYEKFCQRKEWQTKILDISYGKGVGPDNRPGIKTAIMEIEGKFAYGFLKKEQGVHRLVRNSPFSANQLRHTSFALVEIIPEISEIKEIEIRPEEIKIETFHASGHGGQYVNKRETAIRLIHLPTNTIVTCQSERSLEQNKKRAMRVLYSKIIQAIEEAKKKEISEIKGKKVEPSWGNQVRNYVFHPYRLVKDLRTKFETTQIEKTLNGEIDEFINEEIKL